MKKQSLIKGTLILGIAGITARFLGIFFRWPLIMLIGDEGVGYYQMSYPLYTFFVAAASGIPVAISKMVSEKNAVGDVNGSYEVLNKALILMTILGGGFSLFLLIFSHNLVSFFKWDAKSYYALIGIAFAPIVISIMSAFRGFFQGLQNMNPTAVSQIIEQLGRVIIGVGLAYLLLPRGIEFSAGGAALGAAAGGLLAGIFLVTKFIRVKNEMQNFNVEYKEKGGLLKSFTRNFEVMNKLLYIAIPISLGATVGTIMSLIDSLLVPQKLLEAGFTYKESTVLYGQLTGKAFVLINVPLTLSMALCASLVPIIAEAFILNKRAQLMSKVEAALKISMVIALPSFLGLYFMAYPVLQLIFPGHSDGYVILKYLSPCIPFIILAQTSTAILQGSGRYIKPVINLAAGCLVKVIISYVLVPIPSINVYGAIIGTITGYILSSVLNLIDMKKALNINISFSDSFIKPLVASIIMIFTVVNIYYYSLRLTSRNSISCLAAVFTGIIIYAILVLLLGIFKYENVKDRILKRRRT